MKKQNREAIARLQNKKKCKWPVTCHVRRIRILAPYPHNGADGLLSIAQRISAEETPRLFGAAPFKNCSVHLN